MNCKLSLAMWATAVICVCSLAPADAQDALAHGAAAQEIAEALPGSSAAISCSGSSHRASRDVDPLGDGNQEFRLSGAAEGDLPNESSLAYRLFLPPRTTDFLLEDSGAGDLVLPAHWVPNGDPLILSYRAALVPPAASDSLGTADAEEAPAHKVTAQEVAEALADPSATISYFNVSYRAYMDVGPEDDTNQEFRLNGAGFFNLPGESSLMYRVYLPVYVSDFPQDDSGVGDLLLSAYWVPKPGTFILGYGAALITPTASEDYYGTDKWSAGPTLVIAKKVPGKYTVGGLLTHVWSFAGDSDREDVSMTTIQPAATLFIGHGTSFIVASETTYNWEADEDPWQVPVTLGVSQILPPFGKFFVGVGLAGSYYIEKSDYAPEWDVRAVVSVVFP